MSDEEWALFERFILTARAPIHLLVNAHGLPMRTEITPGQTSDYLGFHLVSRCSSRARAAAFCLALS